jgi:DNA-binding MarR family transcriptional regulator
MSGSRSEKTTLAASVWRMMFDLLMRTAPQRTKILSERGLTPNDSRALFSIERHKGRTMRSLADEWQCDPSYTTWVVDRLEKLGLAERRAVSHDRRVKLVMLTRKGEKTRADLLNEFHRPPSDLAALDRENLESLHRVLIKLSHDPSAHKKDSRRPLHNMLKS